VAEKYFNRQEAEELLPQIGLLLRAACKQKRAIESLVVEIAQVTSRLMMLGGALPPYAQLSHKKSESEKGRAKLAETIDKIQRTGCVVKDLDVGLVDFPTLRGGEEVCLCWKLGEEHIEYWHGIDEGFAGRKPLADSGRGEDRPGQRRPQ